jgi:hypothetical protein
MFARVTSPSGLKIQSQGVWPKTSGCAVIQLAAFLS